MSRARVHRVNGCRWRAPVAEDALEPTCTQVLDAAEDGEEADAEPSDRRRVQDEVVADCDPGRHDHLDGATRALEAQGRRLEASTEEQAVVVLQVLGRARS